MQQFKHTSYGQCSGFINENASSAKATWETKSLNAGTKGMHLCLIISIVRDVMSPQKNLVITKIYSNCHI